MTEPRDTIVVPAQDAGFKDVFLGQNCWYAIRIARGMLSRIRYIAVYRTAPVGAITHYAEVDHIEAYGEKGKYRVVFAGTAMPLGPIALGSASKGSMQGPRYTSLAKLKAAKTLTDLSK